MSRERLITRIVGLVALTQSNRIGEARSAEQKALELIDRYGVAVEELPAASVLSLRAIAAALFLTVQRNRWTRRMSEIGGPHDRWLTTGRGEIGTRAMIAEAEAAGFVSRWSA